MKRGRERRGRLRDQARVAGYREEDLSPWTSEYDTSSDEDAKGKAGGKGKMDPKGAGGTSSASKDAGVALARKRASSAEMVVGFSKYKHNVVGGLHGAGRARASSGGGGGGVGVMPIEEEEAWCFEDYMQDYGYTKSSLSSVAWAVGASEGRATSSRRGAGKSSSAATNKRVGAPPAAKQKRAGKERLLPPDSSPRGGVGGGASRAVGAAASRAGGASRAAGKKKKKRYPGKDQDDWKKAFPAEEDSELWFQQWADAGFPSEGAEGGLENYDNAAAAAEEFYEEEAVLGPGGEQEELVPDYDEEEQHAEAPELPPQEGVLVALASPQEELPDYDEDEQFRHYDGTSTEEVGRSTAVVQFVAGDGMEGDSEGEQGGSEGDRTGGLGPSAMEVEGAHDERLRQIPADAGPLGRERAGLSASDRFQTGFRPVS